jgi:hypothetical protein
MKKNIVFLLLLLSFACKMLAQTEEVVVIEQSAQIIAVDPQGNLYTVEENSLHKYTPFGQHLYSYTNNMLGSIYSIDVDNPLKIMVFFQDAGIILFLNDKLSPIGDAVNLFSKGLTTISLATYSTKNNLILFDEANTDLIILDFYFNVKERIHYDFNDFHPLMLNDIHEKMMLMQDTRQGIFFFDGFGTFEKNIAIYADYPVQWLDNQIIYLKDNKLNSYNHQNLEAKIITDVPQNVTQALIYRDKLILATEKNIKIMQIQ